MTLGIVREVAKGAEALKTIQTALQVTNGAAEIGKALTVIKKVGDLDLASASQSSTVSVNTQVFGDLPASVVNLLKSDASEEAIAAELKGTNLVLQDITDEDGEKIGSAIVAADFSVADVKTAAAEGNEMIAVTEATVAEIAEQEGITDVDAKAVVAALEAEGKTEATAGDIKA